jgi:pyruvate/2-oxoglutarate dehydrogenase complex dihydrolipoamide dehydrogenase (E3) component
MKDNDKLENKKTVLVVGGGPAGVQAALRAHELGATVTLLESDKLGGTAFNEGSAPIRTLARAARLRTDAELYPQFGLEGEVPAVDFKAAIDNANQVAAHANEVWHLKKLVEQQDIEVIDEVGPAHFVNNNTLEIGDGRQFSGDKIILSVGGKPKKLSIPGHELALSFHDLWSMTRLPERVTVVGGSATGCQLASILINFGAKVDIIEFAERLTPPSDADISRSLEAAFKARGMNVLTSTGCESIAKEDGQLKVTYKHDDQTDSLMTDAVFLMVGWPADLDGLNLEATDIKVDGPYIEVDDYLQTNVEGVYVAGDANGISMFVQSAAHQARVAAQNAVSDSAERYNPRAIATGSFTQPEYASVGMTQAEAIEAHECIVEIVDYEALPRAVMDGRTNGFCKIIIDKQTQQLLGAHVLGSYSAEVIQVAATCIATKMTVQEIANLELAFPTFTEALGMAALRMCRDLRLEDKAVKE